MRNINVKEMRSHRFNRNQNTYNGRKWMRRGEESNYQPGAEHMYAGLCWNRDEPRSDSFYNFISCTDPSFIIAAYTHTHVHTDTS